MLNIVCNYLLTPIDKWEWTHNGLLIDNLWVVIKSKKEDSNDEQCW